MTDNTQVVQLIKGQRVNLSKKGNYKHLDVIVGWKQPISYDNAQDYDVDVSVFCLSNTSGKLICPSPDYMAFYNNKTIGDNVIVYHGDVRNGKVDVEEKVSIDVDKLIAIPNINQIDIVVTIHEAKMKNQNFGQLSNAFVKVIDTDTGNIVLQYDLAEQYSTETAVLIASMYRNDEQNLVFKAEGGGFAVGLDAFCVEYGLSV